MHHITKQTLLPFIQPFLPANPIIIEAGAFTGGDTQRLSSFWPQATIHAFEPVPDIFALLKTNVSSLHNVHCHPMGLSDTTGTAQFYVSESPKKPGAPFQAGSLLKPKERLKLSPVQYNKTITINAITLDDWAQQNNIPHVDFAWLDMQGYELNVLKASPRMLATLKVIYTEVEFVEAYENQYMYHDVRTWLEAQGFIMIARDFSDNPDWFYGNAVFVKKD
jgi:FkbM family methyltransferase